LCSADSLRREQSCSMPIPGMSKFIMMRSARTVRWICSTSSVEADVNTRISAQSKKVFFFLSIVFMS